MEVVSAREFRANQRKYFGIAYEGGDVILKSRDWGSFKLVPVTSMENVTSKETAASQPDLTERICQALQEVKLIREGKLKAKSIDELLDEL